MITNLYATIQADCNSTKTVKCASMELKHILSSRKNATCRSVSTPIRTSTTPLNARISTSRTFSTANQTTASIIWTARTAEATSIRMSWSHKVKNVRHSNLFALLKMVRNSSYIMNVNSVPIGACDQ